MTTYISDEVIPNLMRVEYEQWELKLTLTETVSNFV